MKLSDLSFEAFPGPGEVGQSLLYHQKHPAFLSASIMSEADLEDQTLTLDSWSKDVDAFAGVLEHLCALLPAEDGQDDLPDAFFREWGHACGWTQRFRHYATHSDHVLADDRPAPRSPVETDYFPRLRLLLDRMAASGELQAREELWCENVRAFRRLDQVFKDDHLHAGTLTDRNAGETERLAALHALAELRAANYQQAARRLAEHLSQGLVDIGERFRLRYGKQDAPRRTMQRPQNPLTVPAVMPSYTFAEAREVQRALGDGPSQKNWLGIDGELAMRHAIQGEPLQTKFVPSTRLLEYSQWLTRKADERTIDLLAGELRRLEFDSNLLFGVCLSLVIEKGGFSASLDELGSLIGWQPKTAREREENRLKLWLWLLLFDSLRVIGLRKGRFPDPDDKKKVRDLSSDDDLLHISGTLADVQRRLDNVPFEVSLTSGPWIQKVRGDKSVLSFLGNLKALAAKPRGRFPARLAVKIGMALLQEWREESAHKETVVRRNGEQNRLSVQFKPFTRKDLLTTYGQEAAREMEALLGGDNPGHAIEYWDKAIANLRKWGIICYYQQGEPQPGTGYGWQKTWYEEQRLDIRPGQALAVDVAEIKEAKKIADKKRGAARKRKQTEAKATGIS